MAANRIALVSCFSSFSRDPINASLQVTGGNQGIGLEIVRQLCKQFDGQVVLAGQSIDLQ